MIRELEKEDYHKGYFDLLAQLTKISDSHTEEEFAEQVEIINQNKFHKIFVIECDDKIAGTLTCLVEPKFIRSMKSVCHIEDVVVDSQYRGKRFAGLLLKHAEQFAIQNNCYKIILDCSEDYLPFYEKNGYKTGNYQMQNRLDSS
jgi:glucosamine-phosphate N-acetyltransferase